ncbi:MAG: LuxR C-terminal-related transcriptional regulator [Pseudomonadota bacterium]
MNRTTDTVTTLAVDHAAAPELPDIIEAIGSDRFGPQLLAYLHQMCGADHCAVFQFGTDSLSQVVVGSHDGTNAARQQATRYVDQQYWRKDPAMCEAQSRVRLKEPVIIRVDIDDLADTDLRENIYPHIRERLVIAGKRRESAFGLSILRSDVHGAFTDGDIHRLGSVAEVLVSLLAKHADIVLHRPNIALALTSLPEIEGCMLAMTELPRREAQVCARVLYGLSTIGIALDLSIGEESVKTYRKRAYQRLQIGCGRELLTWYLTLWSEWKGRIFFGAGAQAAPRLVLN